LNRGRALLLGLCLCTGAAAAGTYEPRPMVDDGNQTIARSKPFTVEASR
jgi:hypothetical protein